MQNAAFAAAGVDGAYVALRCSAPDVAALVTTFARAGGGGNVTIPHKRIAAAIVESATDDVSATGACNTFWLENGRIRGDNTDVVGFATAARALLGSMRGVRSLIIGSGGAARAAVRALLQDGAEAFVVGRSAVSLQELVARLDPAGERMTVAHDPTDFADPSFDLIVNATPLGLQDGDPLPVDLTRLRHAGAVLDMVYGERETAFTRHAAACGVPAMDGSEMLVAQGAAAFERWWRVPAPIDVMREAIRARRRENPAHLS